MAISSLNNISRCTIKASHETGKSIVFYATELDPTPRPLFSYFSDELQFMPHEFIGLSVEEGRALFTKKDIAYLQS